MGLDAYEMYQAMAENETVAQLPVLDGVTDWAARIRKAVGE